MDYVPYIRNTKMHCKYNAHNNTNVVFMKLKESCIQLIKQSKRIKNRLAFDLDIAPDSLRRWLRDNAPNGPLTTVKAISIIKAETGLETSAILEEQELESV